MALSREELQQIEKNWKQGKAKQAEMSTKSNQAPAKNRYVPTLEKKKEIAQKAQDNRDMQSMQMANDLMASQKSVPIQPDTSMPTSVNKLSGTTDMSLPSGVTKFGDSKPSNLNLNNMPSDTLEPMKKGGATWTKAYDYENAWKPLSRTERQGLEREARNIQSKGTSASMEEMDRLREIYDIVDENDRKVAVNDKSNIDKYLSPNYRLSSQEESIAKEMIDNYFNDNPTAKKLLQASSSNANRASKIRSQMTKKEQEEYAKMTALMNKTSNLSAFTYGMLNIMPFGNTAMDKMGELMGVDDAYNYSAQEKNVKTQSPLAYMGGDMTSKLAAYSVLGGELEKIPALAKATNGAGSFLTGGNKVARNMIGNVLRGDIADIILDTIPTEIENYRNGMSGTDIAKDTALNLLGNTAFNAVGEVVPYLWKSARGQLGNVAEEATNLPTKSNLEMEREALQSSQNDMDALAQYLRENPTDVPPNAPTPVRPTNLEMEQASNVDNMDVLRQAMAEQEAERVAREEAERIAREQAAREVPRVGEEPSVIKNEPLNDVKAPNEVSPAQDIKQKQLDIINKTNPAPDDQHAWVRDLDDIKTFEEVWKEDPDIDPDFTDEMAQEAMRTGKIKVYSSYNIEDGTFVTPSYMEALAYAGDPNNVKSAVVNLDDVAWIDSTQGQLAKVAKETPVEEVAEKANKNFHEYVNTKKLQNGIKFDNEAEVNAAKASGEVAEQVAKEVPADADKIARYQRLLNDEDYLNSEAKRLAERDTAMGFAKDIDQAKMELQDLARRNLKNVDADNVAKEVPTPNKVMAEDIGLNPNTVLDDEANTIEEEIARNEPYDLTFDPANYEKGNTKVSQTYTNTGRNGNGWNEGEYGKYTDPSNYTYESASEAESVAKAEQARLDEGREAYKEARLNKDGLTHEDVDGLMMEWRETIEDARALEAEGGDASALWEESNRIFRKIQQEETHNAQALQALAKWSRNTPEGMLMEAEQIVNGKIKKPRLSASEKLLNKVMKQHREIEFSAEFQKKFLAEAEKLQKLDIDSREAKEIMGNLGKMVNAEIPVKLSDKVQTILMDNMLGNFRTLIARNAGGNVGLNVMEQLAERPLAAAIDSLVSLKTGVRKQAGLSVEGLKEYMQGFGKGLKDEGLDVLHGVHTARSGENTIKNAIDANHQVFKSRVGKIYDGLVKHGLSVGDRPFYEAVYKQTLGDYYRLWEKGQMGDVLQSLTEKQFNEYAKLAANTNALAAVYQDNSELAKAFTGMKNDIGMLSEGLFGVDILSQFSMPFVKTPANVVNRAIDYSPLGLVRNSFRTGKELKAGTFDQGRFVNEAARNILGTGLMGGAAVGAKNALMTGGYSEDAEEKAAQKERGMQEFAFRYHDKDGNEKNMDISWIPVVGSNAVAAAAAYDAYKNGEGNALDNLAAGAKAGAQSMFDQSFFQGMQRLFGTGETYNSDKGIGENIANVVKQGTGQAIPSLARQIAQVSDPYQRDVSNSNGGNYDLNSIIKNIPGARQALLAPKVGTNGELMLESQGRSLGHRILEDMISPGKVTEIQPDALSDEAKRLSDITGNTDAYKPKASVKKLELEEPLTNEQIVEYEQKFGDTIDKAGKATINNSYYNSLDTESQENLLKNVYGSVKDAINHEYNGKEDNGGAKAFRSAYNLAGGGDAGTQAGIKAVIDYHMSKALMGTSSEWTRDLYSSGDQTKINNYKKAKDIAKTYGQDSISENEFKIYEHKGDAAFRTELKYKQMAKDVGLKSATEGFKKAVGNGMSPQQYADEDKLIKSIQIGTDEFGDPQYLDHDETTGQILKDYGEAGLRDYATIKQAGGTKTTYNAFRLYSKKAGTTPTIPSLDPSQYMSQVEKIEKYNPKGQSNGEVSQEELETYLKDNNYSLDAARSYAQAFFGDDYTVNVTKKGKYDIKKKK
jgi:hypothetical protein